LPFWDTFIFSILGIILLILGGLFLITGRYQLKQFGSGVLHIEEDHKMITSGIFQYIRHPIYAGSLLGIFGFYLAFRSIIILIAVSVIYFLIFRHRLTFEEELLIKEFGDQYKEYMQRTKRLIPYLY
ncbi:MAG: methyltransferase family protein, partial [Candidatus Hodarchaeota archaeon]